MNQVDNMPGIWILGGVLRGYDGVGDAQGNGIFLLDWEIFDSISFELSGEALVQVYASLGVGVFSGVR